MTPDDLTKPVETASHPSSGEPAPGPAAAEEILDEWGAIEQLSRRLNDPLWQLEPQFLQGPPSRAPDPSSNYAASEGPLRAKLVPVPAPQRSWLQRLGDLAGASYQQTLGSLFRTVYRRAVGVTYHSGADVLAALSADTARRLQSLIAVERALHRGVDYSVVIAPACVCLELVLGELLRPINRIRARSLAGALDRTGWPRQAELLRKWADGGLPMTMGLQVTILAALEKADAWLQDFVAIRDLKTTGPYLEIVRSGKLAALLEQVRTNYRNPACHGTRTFDRAEYAALARLLLTRDSFRAWYRRGPALLDTGLLDLHLLVWRQRQASLS
jgi:hypothetical protein